MIAVLVAYLVNALWVTPAIVVAAEGLGRAAPLSAAARCRLWRGVMAFAVLAPAAAEWLISSGGEFGAPGSPASPLALDARLGSAWIWVCFGCAAAGVFRLSFGLCSLRRLRTRSLHWPLSARLSRRLRPYTLRLGVAVPEIRIVGGIKGPALAGWRRPTLLAPEDLRTLSEEQVLAILLHETAHVARADFGWNLIVEALALPLNWHPATIWIRRRVHLAREMACDELAAAALPRTYAERLVELARIFADRQARGAAMALGNAGELEMRVQALLADKGERVQRPTLCGTAAAVTFGAVGALVVLLHVTTTLITHVHRSALPFASAATSSPARTSRRVDAATALVTGGRPLLMTVREPDGAYTVYRLTRGEDGRPQSMGELRRPFRSWREVKSTIA